MPRIPDDLLETVIYLYPSKDAAEAGSDQGGTGFLVDIPAEPCDPEFPDLVATYAVTNKHVIDEGHPVIRVNARDSGFHTIPLGRNDWVCSTEDDVAVANLVLDTANHRFRTLAWPNWELKLEDTTDDFRIGPGDETFFIGRFIGREGRAQNYPSVRFGNITMMPDAENDMFSVEGRSLSGFSGSPVFGISPPWSWRGEGSQGMTRVDGFRALLGIDTGHEAMLLPLRDADGNPLGSGRVTVEWHSGMTNVLPAWRIRNLLYRSDLIERRRKGAAAFKQQPVVITIPDSTAETSN